MLLERKNIHHIKLTHVCLNFYELELQLITQITNEFNEPIGVKVLTSYLKENNTFWIIKAAHPKYFLESTLLDEDYIYEVVFQFFLKPRQSAATFNFSVEIISTYSQKLLNEFYDGSKRSIIESINFFTSHLNYSTPFLKTMLGDDFIFPLDNIASIDLLYRSSRRANGFDLLLRGVNFKELILMPCGITTIHLAMNNNIMEIVGRNGFLLLRSSISRLGIRIQEIKMRRLFLSVTLVNSTHGQIRLGERIFQFVPMPEMQPLFSLFSIGRQVGLSISKLQFLYKEIFGIPTHLVNAERDKKEEFYIN